MRKKKGKGRRKVKEGGKVGEREEDGEGERKVKCNGQEREENTMRSVRDDIE